MTTSMSGEGKRGHLRGTKGTAESDLLSTKPSSSRQNGMPKSISAAVFAFASIVLAQQEPAPAPPARLVDLGGYRIHLNCSGGDSSTVVLSPGGGGRLLNHLR